MKKFIVVAYDIVDDRRRTEVSDLLSRYGTRVNRSVFECFLSDREIGKVKKSVGEKIREGEDIVLYYHLCRDCLERIERQGIENEEKSAVKVF
jgi:CRISPR-associated protein Cas2